MLFPAYQQTAGSVLPPGHDRPATRLIWRTALAARTSRTIAMLLASVWETLTPIGGTFTELGQPENTVALLRADLVADVSAAAVALRRSRPHDASPGRESTTNASQNSSVVTQLLYASNSRPAAGGQRGNEGQQRPQIRPFIIGVLPPSSPHELRLGGSTSPPAPDRLCAHALLLHQMR